MKFLFDENISKYAVAVLRETYKRRIDDSYMHLTEEYALGTADDEWILDAAESDIKPIVITCDIRILKTPINKMAVKESGLTFMIYPKEFTRQDYSEQIWMLITSWDPLIEAVGNIVHPTPFRISMFRKRPTIRIEPVNI